MSFIAALSGLIGRFFYLNLDRTITASNPQAADDGKPKFRQTEYKPTRFCFENPLNYRHPPGLLLRLLLLTKFTVNV